MIDGMKVYCSCVGSTLHQPLPTRPFGFLGSISPVAFLSTLALPSSKTSLNLYHRILSKMDNPTEDITQVVHTLCQGTPDQQTEAINTYFTPNASFTHPFCRTGSFDGSRNLIHAIYKWYKLLSPKVELNVNGIGKIHHHSPQSTQFQLTPLPKQPTTPAT